MNQTEFQTWEDAVSWLISQPEQREIVQACYYDTPLKAAADRYWQSSEWQAIREFFPPCQEKALEIGAGNGIASYALAKDGWQGFLRLMTGKLRPVRNFSTVAAYHATLGEKDKAFAELEKAYETREWSLINLKVDPRLDALRDDPRFQDLMRRVGFPQ